MTPADLAKLRTLETQATKGPWENRRQVSTSVTGPDGRGVCSTGGYQRNTDDTINEVNDANAALIIQSRNALPELITAAEALHTLAGMRERIEAAIKPNHVTICAVTRGKLLADLLALLPLQTPETS